MHYPLINREVLSYLRLFHAAYNLSMVFLFLHQGWLGIRIRRARISHAQVPLSVTRRHRTAGPVLAVLGVFGFFIGLTLVLLDTGNVLEYPPHFIVGLLIVPVIIAMVVLGRRIRTTKSPYRTPHFIIGIFMMVLYFLEVFLGVGVLF